jgi:hypothetical protein
MDTFMIGSRRLWLLRAVGRNPLVRRSDRVEAWSVLVAVVVLAVVTPFVCAYGTSVHDARVRLYALEAQHRHPVIATATEEGRSDGEPGSTSHTVRGRWSAFGQEHVDIVKWSELANIGDQQRIWVDDAGHEVMAPRSASRAATDAWVLGITVWLVLLSAVAGALCAIRWLLNTQRVAQWDVEINTALREP